MMAFLLFIIAAISYVGGFLVWEGSVGALHQIAAIAFFINGTVAFIGAAISEKMDVLHNKIDALHKMIDEPAAPKSRPEPPPPRRKEHSENPRRKREPRFD